MRLVIIIALFGTAAHANPLEGINREHSICFAREFSNKDLQDRPKQTVTAIHADLSKQPDENDPTIYLNLKIIANGHHYDSFMICDESGENLKCMVECDGGHAEIFGTNRGIEFLNQGFLMSGGCSGQNQEEPVVWLTPSVHGDDVFSLPAASCD